MINNLNICQILLLILQQLQHNQTVQSQVSQAYDSFTGPWVQFS